VIYDRQSKRQIRHAPDNSYARQRKTIAKITKLVGKIEFYLLQEHFIARKIQDSTEIHYADYNY